MSTPAEIGAQLEAMGDWRSILDQELADMAATTKRINALSRRAGGHAPREGAAPVPLGTASRADLSPGGPSCAATADLRSGPVSGVIPPAAANTTEGDHMASTASLSGTDRQLLTESAALAAASSPAELRAFLGSVGSPYATETDYNILASACLGRARANLNALISLITRETTGA